MKYQLPVNQSRANCEIMMFGEAGGGLREKNWLKIKLVEEIIENTRDLIGSDKNTVALFQNLREQEDYFKVLKL